jgi:HPr kinase/phosphorylase
MAGMTVAEFHERTRTTLNLRVLTRSVHSRSPITTPDINRPQLALTGFLEKFLWERIQVIGQTEIAYLRTLSPKGCEQAICNIMQFPIPCIVITKALEPPGCLVEQAHHNEIPVLQTEMATTPFLHSAAAFLDEAFSPTTTVHGSLVAGRSAIGKSECALDLVERGHRLVADDVVTIKRRHENVLIGSGNELLRHCMEIRGIGIIDVQSIFGIRAIRAQKRVEVEVNLREWDDQEGYERLGLEEKHTTILGVRIPLVIVPIFPGKNITVIAEAISLNYLVRSYGYNPAERFNDNLMQLIRRKGSLEILAKDDLE